MGDNKDKHGGISASLQKVGAGNNVRRQLDAGKVSMNTHNRQKIKVTGLANDDYLDTLCRVKKRTSGSIDSARTINGGRVSRWLPNSVLLCDHVVTTTRKKNRARGLVGINGQKTLFLLLVFVFLSCPAQSKSNVVIA